MDWLDLRDRAVPPDVRRGLAQLLAAIIDGMAVQETIFGSSYEPRATLEVLRKVLVDLVPRLIDTE